LPGIFNAEKKFIRAEFNSFGKISAVFDPCRIFAEIQQFFYPFSHRRPISFLNIYRK
jgi:hypothetical protein